MEKQIKLNMTKETPGTIVYAHDAPKAEQIFTALYVRKMDDGGKQILTDENLSASVIAGYAKDSKGGAARIFAIESGSEILGATNRCIYLSKVESLDEFGDRIKFSVKVSKKSKFDSTAEETKGKQYYKTILVTLEVA